MRKEEEERERERERGERKGGGKVGNYFKKNITKLFKNLNIIDAVMKEGITK